MRSQAGFTLIEIIACVVLLGIIATFGTMFLTTGIRGSVLSMQAADYGQRAQMALDRIALELRDANGGPGGAIQVYPTGATPRIEYTTSLAKLPGTRTLKYTPGTGVLALNTGGATDYPLLDELTACSMSAVASGATSTLTISVTINNSSTPFSITVKPRNTSVSPVVH